MSEDELLSALISLKLVTKCEQNFDDAKPKKSFLMNQGINFLNKKQMRIEEIFMK